MINSRFNKASNPDNLDPIDRVRQDEGLKKSGDHRKPKKSRGHKQNQDRPRTQAASARSLTAAEHWVAGGVKAGLENPANAPWLSHRIQAKVTRDPVIKPYLLANRHDEVSRLLAKMADLYWSEYFTAEVKPGEAVFDFLDVAWDDVRDYAVDCLRAAYLKEHGVRVPTPVYEDRDEQEMQQALDAVKFGEWLDKARNAPPPPEHKPLDPKHKDVLRSHLARRQEEDE